MKRKATFILACLIVLIAAFISWWLLRSAPTQQTAEKTKSAKIVQTIAPTPEDHPVTVSAYGSVIPSRSVTIRPEITGRIISQNPSLVPGGRISEGAILLTIDDSDYQLALREARTAMDEATSEVDIEAGRQIVAERELEQLRRDIPAADINEALVLRKPFATRTQAILERATTSVDAAQLNLSRTTIPAPFNALVIEESTETGQLADSGTTLATLVGSDTFWIRASVPLQDLGKIQLPTEDSPGAPATITLTGNGLTWQGNVIRLLADIEEAGRLARLLIEVPAPLDSNPAQPLLLGSYVRAEIEAGTLKDALEIPRSALREGNRIFLATAEETLAIRDTEILWRTENTVYIPNILEEGETLIVSQLSSPLPGMNISPEPLTTESED
ncbi:efflux RND transporter periplasmic adaptor subunit [Luteolibacter sp. AS25]|uniref:efflux RND transporter periplasmic adaptor subunit n=1 Tax=Luteolibacter sp. AS25 TaxID=3135776 RepID=UPI00398A70DC